jgi:hypothetical protein
LRVLGVAPSLRPSIPAWGIAARGRQRRAAGARAFHFTPVARATCAAHALTGLPSFKAVKAASGSVSE